MLDIRSGLKLIVYDFDGVMTDNKVYLNQNGNESVRVNRADGLAISEIKKLGILQIIISTEKNPVVLARANKVGIKCLQSIKDKKETLIAYCKKQKIDLQNVLFIGNDINDKEAMKICGICFCPFDAHNDIKDISDKILNTKGGNGVIRELYDKIRG